jgi:predicted cytidylate kinase
MERMIITISGPPGSGKTTAAKLLSQKLDLNLVIIGEIFRDFAKERGLTLAELGKIAEEDHNIDTELDNRVLEIAGKGNIILEGRLAGLFLEKHGVDAFRIWIDAPLTIRAERIAGRENKDPEMVRGEIEVREACERDRYKDIYGFDMGDKSIYDLVLDSSEMAPEEIIERILKALERR